MLVLIMATLFCLLCVVAVYLFTSLLADVLFTAVGLPEAVVDVLYIVAILLLAWLLLLPVFLGRVRLGGLVAKGEDVLVKEIFYYFTVPARYLRALWMSLVYLFSFALPLGLAAGAFVGAYMLYEHVFWVYLGSVPAILLLILCDLVCAALCVLLLYLTGFYFSAVALLVGNESMGCPEALRYAFCFGSRHRGCIYRFSLRALWHLLLSVLTLGVLWLLYYAQHTTLAYWKLVMTMDTALEDQNSVIGEHYEGIC